jgi:hypothetical protein
MDFFIEITSVYAYSKLCDLWQPAQENTVLSPKPSHIGH